MHTVTGIGYKENCAIMQGKKDTISHVKGDKY